MLRHNGRCLMAVGCRLNGFASCLLYTSEDGLHFRYHSVLAKADGGGAIDVLATPDGREKTTIRLHGNGRLVVDRSVSSLYPTHHSPLERRVSLPMGKTRLEVWGDHSVVEANCNGEWISTRVYPAGEDATHLAIHLSNGEGRCLLSQLRNCNK